MYSVNRTIGVAAIIRTNASIAADNTAPYYGCDIKGAMLGTGLETQLAKAAQIVLKPASFDNSLLGLSAPRLVFAYETNTQLNNNSVPPTDPNLKVTITEASGLQVNHLDASSDTDGIATIEFRFEGALPAAGSSTTTDYNRVYLLADSMDYSFTAMPAHSSVGATEPGVVDTNAAGGATFDPATDLYLLDADNGNVIQDGSSNEVWFDRNSLITTAATEEVVLAAMDIRNTPVDDIEYDILRGSATAQCKVAFRLVI